MKMANVSIIPLRRKSTPSGGATTEAMKVRKKMQLNTPPSKRIAGVLFAGFKHATETAAQSPAVNTMTINARMSTPKYKQTIPNPRQSTASIAAPHPATINTVILGFGAAAERWRFATPALVASLNACAGCRCKSVAGGRGRVATFNLCPQGHVTILPAAEIGTVNARSQALHFSESLDCAVELIMRVKLRLDSFG